MNLDEDLARRVSGCRKKALLNYYAEYVFLAISVIASTAATISVASGGLTKEINAILAALPGIVLLITNTFRFESRSDLWWKKYEVFDSLYRELKYEGVKEEEVSKKMSALLKEYGDKWVRFGKPPSGKIP
ncbi:MAG: hypothetical protein WC504_17195 [Methylobacter sp.]